MKALLYVAVGLGLTTVAFCTGRSSPTTDVRTRSVAFDNLYSGVTTLPVNVSVDGGAEQRLIATCDAKTCTFKLPLTNAKHELLMVVEQNGKRSTPTRVALDTSDMR
jgi:hypothetical protein